MSAGHIIGGPPDPDYHGAVLTADLAIGDTVLHVDDIADFDEDASLRDARILLGLDSSASGALDPTNATSLAYATCDDDTSTVTLSAPSTVAASSGDRIYVQDPISGLPVVDYVVMVAHDDGDTTGDALPVTLTHGIAVSVGDLSDLDGQSIIFDEDEDGELIASDLPGLDASAGSVLAYQDSITVTSLGDQTLHLTYKPLPDTSVHLYWNGVFQPDSEWTRDGWDMTIPDGAGYIEAGDVLMAKYLYIDPTRNPIECRKITLLPGNVTVHGPEPIGGGSYLPANPSSVVVGASDQWADGSDATYGTETTGSTMGYTGTDILEAPMPTLGSLGIDPATVTDAVLQIRVSSGVSAAAYIPILNDNVNEDAVAAHANFGDSSGPYSDVTPDTTTEAPLPPKGSTVADVAAALSGPSPVLRVVTSSGISDFTVYEAALILTVCKPVSEWT